jgi:hypothetical protein
MNAAKPLAISTGQLRASRPLHIRPIYLVVFQGPSISEETPSPHLEVGFPLRCFQRLSVPGIATLPCPERDNRYTRGRYLPILSY